MPAITKSSKTDKAEVPDSLRPYIFHGIELRWKNGEKNASGTCPFCGRDKFNVELATGKYRCLVCAEGTAKGGGNWYVFIRKLWEASKATTTEAMLKKLAKDRGLYYWQTLQAWGVRWSEQTNDWIVPGYSINGNLTQLYRYIAIDGQPRLILTPTLGQKLFAPMPPKLPAVETVAQRTLLDGKDNAYVCEGVWDAMALWEVLGNCKHGEIGLIKTGNPNSSILGSSTVLAVPGCTVFPEQWLPLFRGKSVALLYDSDLPKRLGKGDRIAPPAGYTNMERVSKLLMGSKMPPAYVNYLFWGQDGYDPKLPSGYDIRDLITKPSANGRKGPKPLNAMAANGEMVNVNGIGTVKALEARIASASRLFSMLRPMPQEWLVGLSTGLKRPNVQSNGEQIELMPCETYADLVESWKKALNWIDGLDCALSVMLASATSTMAVGDQLWVKIVGPPSCGKSTLCEALSTNRDHVVAKSTIRGFHSGYKTDAGGEEDNSLMAVIKGKTLITKDGDTLLQSPNLGQILSEARDLYDSTSRTSYRNALNREYLHHRVTWILCGTGSLRALDQSELGERFLDCKVMEGIDDDMEDEVLLRVARRSMSSLAMESNGRAESFYEPQLQEAMAKTGYYVGYLRENAQELLARVTLPDDALRYCAKLGKFVAFLRARPSATQTQVAEREFGARLVSQMVRMAGCLAAVMNKTVIDAEIIRRVRKVAFDTGKGITYTIFEYLYKQGVEGAELKAIALHSTQKEDEARKLLRFMKQIGAVETHAQKSIAGITPRPKWRLTEKLKALWEQIVTQ